MSWRRRGSSAFAGSELAGRCLAGNFEPAVTTARERLAEVNPCSIHARANRQVREQLTVVSARHDQLLRISTPIKSRRFFVSINIPTGAPRGATGQRAITFLALISTTAASFLSTRFT